MTEKPAERPSRRFEIFELRPELALELWTRSSRLVLPKDATFHSWQIRDNTRGNIQIIIESATFAEVSEGSEIPRGDYIVKQGCV